MKKFIGIILLLVMLGTLSAGCLGPDEGESTPTPTPTPTETETPEEKILYVAAMKPADMMAQFESGDIDGFIAWEPYNAEVVVNGNGKYLIQSGEVWNNHPCCVLASSDDFKDETALKALVWAHVQATRFMNDPANEDKTLKYAVEFTNKDEDVVEEAISNIEFTEYPDVEEIRTYYRKLDENEFLKKTLADLDYQSEDEFFSDFLLSTYYDEVAANLTEDPEWKPDPVPNSTVVRIGYLTADLHQVAIYVAQKEGFYEEVGLIPGENLNIMPPYSNGPAVMEAFKNKDIDVSYLGGAPATLKRINDDTPIHVISGANNVGSAIVVGKDSGIDTIEDLAGKTIAIPGFGTVQDFIVRIVAENAGLEVQLR